MKTSDTNTDIAFYSVCTQQIYKLFNQIQI